MTPELENENGLYRFRKSRLFWQLPFPRKENKSRQWQGIRYYGREDFT